MQDLSLISVLLTLLGAFIVAISNRLFSQNSADPDTSRGLWKSPTKRPQLRKNRSGIYVLRLFAIIVFVFGAFSVWRYRSAILENQDTLLWGFWLFVTMVGGMFAQVLATNFRSGKGLSDIDRSRLLFPLLFAVIVYYPIWTVAASSTRSLFSIYAAFLNGFFWESVVTSAKIPASQHTN